ATGGILVVAVAVLGSLTVLPAILSKLGDKVMKGRVPVLGRRREQGRESRIWSAVLGAVLRRPKIAASLATAALVAMTIPAFGIATKHDASPYATVEVVELPVAFGTGTDHASNDALATLRNRLIPASIGQVPSATANVSGLTAQSKDFSDQMRQRAPIVFAFV